MIDLVNSWLRRIPTALVYIVCLLPIPWLFYQGLTGQLGVEPIKELEHEYGELALKFLVASLAVTPLRKWPGLNLMKVRRALGLITFAYALAHLLVWLVLDVQILSQIWADILKRPYITVGFAAFLMMLPLAVTSNNLSVRRLGPKWRKLHQLVYPAAILVGLHYIWLAKGFQLEPIVWMTVILGLLAVRFIPKWQKNRRAARSTG